MKKELFLLVACVLLLLTGCVKGSEMPLEQKESITPEEQLSSEQKPSSVPNVEASSAMETVTIKDKTYYMIDNEDDLRAIGNAYPLSGYYLLNHDITLSGEWTPIGDEANPFTGKFVGNGCIIYGLTVTKTSDKIGFFGACNGAKIQNVILEDVTIDPSVSFPLIGVSVNTEVTDCTIKMVTKS